jgi:hypothetical protein
MIGRMFNRLRVLRRGRSTWKHLWFVCQCSCPKKTIREVRSDHLRRGITQSCGCLHREIASAAGNHYKPGKRFGKLTIIAEIGRVRRRGPIYLCQCICGKRTTVQGRHLRSGESRSCGCGFRKRNLKHGKAPASHKIPVYSAYCRQKSWCRNPNDHHWKYYGGRSIRFGFQDFPTFYRHVGDKPNNHCWLMRKDRDGNFEPGNLHWVQRRSRAKKKSPARIGRASKITQGSTDTASPAKFQTLPQDQPSYPCQI